MSAILCTRTAHLVRRFWSTEGRRIRICHSQCGKENQYCVQSLLHQTSYANFARALTCKEPGHNMDFLSRPESDIFGSAVLQLIRICTPDELYWCTDPRTWLQAALFWGKIFHIVSRLFFSCDNFGTCILRHKTHHISALRVCTCLIFVKSRWNIKSTDIFEFELIWRNFFPPNNCWKNTSKCS